MSGERRPMASQSVSPECFPVLRLPLQSGRLLAATDDALASRAALVCESFARRFCPGANPLGRRLRADGM